jgi:hypothetical protein
MLLLIFFNWPNLSTAYLWGGEQLSNPNSDIIYGEVKKQLIRSREYLIPAQNISYAEDDRVSLTVC